MTGTLLGSCVLSYITILIFHDKNNCIFLSVAACITEGQLPFWSYDLKSLLHDEKAKTLHFCWCDSVCIPYFWIKLAVWQFDANEKLSLTTSKRRCSHGLTSCAKTWKTSHIDIHSKTKKTHQRATLNPPISWRENYGSAPEKSRTMLATTMLVIIIFFHQIIKLGFDS